MKITVSTLGDVSILIHTPDKRKITRANPVSKIVFAMYILPPWNVALYFISPPPVEMNSTFKGEGRAANATRHFPKN
jgi:hypothetical protein